MSAPLVTAKFHIPPPRPDLIERRRLLQRLDDGLQLAALSSATARRQSRASRSAFSDPGPIPPQLHPL